MELSELLKNAKQAFGAEEPAELGAAVFAKLNDAETYEKWLSVCPDLTEDNMQPIFQYYMADRKEKKQDYTPKSLARALCMAAGVQNGGTVYDMCAGTGALTIQAWNINPECRFVCVEFDKNVIPFLLFNLAIRNMNALVVHSDVLSEEEFQAWRVIESKNFSAVVPVEEYECIEYKPDICISNPPYNLKFKLPEYAKMLSCYKYGLPPENNANYAFVEKAITMADRAALLLPCTVTSPNTKQEKEIIKNLCKQNLIDGIVVNPDGMFECTSIGTCILLLNRNRDTKFVEMVDMRNTYNEDIRLQKGQFGGSSHENRTYSKVIKTYSDENIQVIISAISERKSIKNLCMAVSTDAIAESKYSLIPTRYIQHEIKWENEHRPYSEIVTDLNKITKERNCCKLVINETLARRLKIPVEDFKEALKGFPKEAKEFYEKISGVSILKSDCIQFTKNKGECSLKANDPENLSSIFEMALQMWAQHIRYLNQQENIILAEFRDAMLPDLMSSKIDPITGDYVKPESTDVLEMTFEEFIKM